MGQIKPMIYRNLFQSNLMHFAKLCKEHGWTKEETLEVIKAVRKEVTDNVCKGEVCFVKDILTKHAMPVIERKRKEQKDKEDNNE